MVFHSLPCRFRIIPADCICDYSVIFERVVDWLFFFNSREQIYAIGNNRNHFRENTIVGAFCDIMMEGYIFLSVVLPASDFFFNGCTPPLKFVFFFILNSLGSNRGNPRLDLESDFIQIFSQTDFIRHIIKSQRIIDSSKLLGDIGTFSAADFQAVAGNQQLYRFPDGSTTDVQTLGQLKFIGQFISHPDIPLFDQVADLLSNSFGK